MNKELRLAIVGLGTVGQALIQRIEDGAYQALSLPLRITAVSARQRDKARAVDITPYVWCDDPLAIAQRDDVDVVVELTGGLEMPMCLAKATIEAGKPWITANKALLAEQGYALASLARARGVTIGFEAAVCGAIPAVKTVREAFAGDQLEAIQGIMNGTCNYIFARMAAGESFAAALADAQVKGYAEADPALDIEGTDAAHKIALLTALSNQQAVDFSQVAIQGIVDAPERAGVILMQAGYAVKLIAQARSTPAGWAVTVGPCAVAADHPMYGIEGVTNAVLLRTVESGDVLLSGPGAGGGATASAVMADIIDCATGRAVIAGGLPNNHYILPLCPPTQYVQNYLLYSHTDDTDVKASFAEAVSVAPQLYRLSAQSAELKQQCQAAGLLDHGGFCLPLA